jgi:hypothetical protein
VDGHYCRVQIVWCIKQAEMLEDGIWPVRETGYIDTHENVQRSVAPVSSLETTLQTWAEISARLDAAGADGETLYSECQAIENPVAFSRAATSALNYIAGRKRKLQRYSQWKADRNRPPKAHKSMGYKTPR